MSKENIKNFLKENKDLIEVTDQEISKLKDEGYVILKRDSKGCICFLTNLNLVFNLAFSL